MTFLDQERRAGGVDVSENRLVGEWRIGDRDIGGELQRGIRGGVRSLGLVVGVVGAEFPHGGDPLGTQKGVAHRLQSTGTPAEVTHRAASERPRILQRMSERITRDEVIHVARLARLELTEAEIDEFTGQLGDILEHAADVEALDVGDIEPTSHPLPMSNILRPDVRRPSLARDEFLAQAPAAESGQFRVPPILGEEP